MAVTAYWEGGYSCRVVIRDRFELRADEPPEDGGADTGPRPTELLLASLASCFAMALAYAGRKQQMELPGDLAVTAIGEYAGPRIRKLRVEVAASLARPQLERLVGEAIGYCWVSNTLKGSPELEFALAEGPAEFRR
jgi:putative redox protein